MHFAKVRIYDPQSYNPDGTMFVDPAALEWNEVAYLEPDLCDHQESMCRECRDSWEIDHEVQLPSWA